MVRKFAPFRSKWKKGLPLEVVYHFLTITVLFDFQPKFSDWIFWINGKQRLNVVHSLSQSEKLLLILVIFVSYYILAAQESLKPEHLPQNTFTQITADTGNLLRLVGLKFIAWKSSQWADIHRNDKKNCLRKRLCSQSRSEHVRNTNAKKYGICTVWALSRRYLC